MKMTSAIRKVKGAFGGYLTALELDDAEIEEIIREETIPQVSIYYPRKVTVPVSTKDSLMADTPESSDYMIKTQEKIVNIAKLITPNNGGSFVNANAGLGRTTGGRFTFTYNPPYEITIMPQPPTSWEYFVLQVNCEQKNLDGFPAGMRRYLLKVILGDVAEAILAERTLFSQIASEIGNIELELQKLEEAISEREETLDFLQDHFNLQGNRTKIYWS